MKNINIKKFLILNVPYLLVGLFATNLGEDVYKRQVCRLWEC